MVPFLDKESGFTLIEIVSVLLIISVLAVMAVSRAGNFIGDSALDSETEAVKDHIRYVQIWSMSNTDRIYGITCTGNTYSAFFINTPSGNFNSLNIAGATQIILPGTDSNTITPANTTVGNYNIAFDFTGRPFSGAGNTLALLGSRLDISVSGSGGGETISITPYTGFIP